MNHDIREGSHAETLDIDNFVSDGERAWMRWVHKVERLLGHDLDGNQDQDGYSLDYACDMFENKLTPEQYVAELQAEPNYKAPAHV